MMMMMKAGESSIGQSNEFEFDCDDDAGLVMDESDFLKILCEKEDNPYLHTGSSQAGPTQDLNLHGSANYHIGNPGNTFDANTGNNTLSENSAETLEVQGQYYPSLSDVPLMSSESCISSMPGVVAAEGHSSFNSTSEDISGGMFGDYQPNSAYYSMSSSPEYLMDTEYQAVSSQPAYSWLGIDMLPALQGVSNMQTNFPDTGGLGFASSSVNSVHFSGINSHNGLSTSVDGASRLPLHWTNSPLLNQMQPVEIHKMENDPLMVSNGPRYQSYGVANQVPYHQFSIGSDAGNFFAHTVSSGHDMKYRGVVKSEGQGNFFDSGGANHVLDTYRHEPPYEVPSIYGEYMDAKPPLNNRVSLQAFPSGSFTIKKRTAETAKMTQSAVASSGIVDIKPESRQVSSMDDDEDSDVCIIENADIPGKVSRRLQFSGYQPSLHASTPYAGNAVLPSQVAPSLDSSSTSTIVPAVADSMISKATDERLIFRAAVQDLSQSSYSETTPTDGLLAVPLLKHQRIALSWMVQKETISWHCCGGILADDQGLGKTVSTIALILKERAPISKTLNSMKNVKLETLDLDGGDIEDTKQNILKDSDQRNGDTTKSPGTSSPTKGRPAGGTLIVCPTSVIRQWAEELRSKVTGKANLSVCVYHGGNRTKDPCELAKYDVVLTTYSIVSMEVQKQSSDDKEDDKLESDCFLPSSNKKRKNSSKSSTRCSKKGQDDVSDETVERPLERVRWFRVVLDEAQSIKNYKTRVAHSCWALRAKRRWCLSGTPLQNVVDDLYSYFRFLRYDPYTTYRSFCELVKHPISKCPEKGYKKLQAVLRTIMLRRTKATIIDGEPIVNLPPKSVVLEKVEFSAEERDFYCRLEADSRARFAEYEADGTIQQNYVNILLMLLRLRQACDHPLLAQGFYSKSTRNSSIEVAAKLPKEKRLSLLTCLEASLAICRICNDSPEDAVVSKCGHVFCNQCISEHFMGDDKQCPASNCKIHITSSSVFSKSMLKRCLSDQALDDSSLNSSSHSSPCSDVTETSQAHPLPDSSKIKAALQVLQSLNRPSDDVENGCERPVTAEPSCSGSSQTVSSSVSPMIKVEGSIIKIKGLNNSANSAPVHKEKAIVFSQWTGMLDLLEPCLKESSIQYRRLDGTMTVLARDRAVQDFNTLPEVTVMIMSLKAASLGLNLVAACHVLLLDLWWNPTTEDQAIDRAHRIGQTRPVSVLRLTVKDTVEDRILALQEKKREMVASAFGEDKTGGRGGRLAVEDLRYLFKMS